MNPSFPDFKPVALEDREVIDRFLKECRPETSEWTFTNLFIWRSHYRFRWSIFRDCLLVMAEGESGQHYALEPLGRSGRREAALNLLAWMRDGLGEESPVIERAQRSFLGDLAGIQSIAIEPSRDHFDYVYLREDLARLEGNRYRNKRNHINKLSRTYQFRYEPLNGANIGECLELQERWCRIRRCSEDLNLLGEWEAVREILTHFSMLNVFGGVIVVEGRVGAFTVGELLDQDTLVVHIEKADPDVPGLYPIINQQFCDKAPASVRFVNREQDLGIAGLREAKLSYYPHHFVEKFRVRLLINDPVLRRREDDGVHRP